MRLVVAVGTVVEDAPEPSVSAELKVFGPEAGDGYEVQRRRRPHSTQRSMSDRVITFCCVHNNGQYVAHIFSQM